MDIQTLGVIVIYGLAVLGLAVGVYEVVTGRVLLRTRRLKEITTTRAGRLVGLSLLMVSLGLFAAARDLDGLRYRGVPSLLMGFLFPPAILAGLLIQWVAFRIDRPAKST
jgi:hypothetical protein